MKQSLQMKTVLFLTALTVSASAPLFSAQPAAGSSEVHDSWLLTDRFGNTAPAKAEEVTPSLQSSGGARWQIPTHQKGASLSDAVTARKLAAYQEEQRKAKPSSPENAWIWFPANQPPMGKTIGSIDQFGNTALQPGALIRRDPVSEGVQQFKSLVSNGGMDYSLHWAYAMAALDNALPGTPSLQQYATSVFELRWNILSSPDRTGTWINMEMDSSYGLGTQSKRQMGIANGLGTAANPNNGEFGPNGSYIVELALMQSFMKGDGVFIAGMVDYTNYFDANRYANSQYGLFMNTALVNSMVLPLTSSNLGMMLHFQLDQNWYLMLGAGANNNQMDHSPFESLSWDNMSYLAEIGWSCDNAFGIGQGTYRIQPFVATVQGETQPGVALNFNQDLGHSPWALFGRFGVGGNKVTNLRGAQAQIAGGVALKRPMNVLGICEEDSNNFFGVAGIWTKTPGPSQAVGGRDETGIEFNYSIQLTQTMVVQPNFQIFFNPANNSRENMASVFQLQLSSSW